MIPAITARSLAVGLCALAALAAAGCGSSGSDRQSSTRTSSTSKAHAGARGRVPAVGQTTATVGATTSQTTTKTSSTTALPGTGKPVVTIGDKNYTEQFVLGQLYLQALQAQGFTVNITQNIGTPASFMGALKTGQLAMYPDYLDTFNTTIARYRHPFRTQLEAYAAAARWGAAHGLELLPPTPFSDTWGIGVTVAYAAEHHVRAVADLRRVATSLTMGGASLFAHGAQGLPTLAAVYGVIPAKFSPLPVGNQYSELNDGSVQAAYVNTTDGQLASGDYRLLSDPKRIFGWGNVVPVVSTTALTREGPAFAETIERVDDALTLQAIRALNWAVDVAKQDPATAAKQFLQTHGLLAPLAP